MISSGALPNVAFRKPPIPGPVWKREIVGCLADQPRERDQRRRGEHEHGQVAGSVTPIQDNRERPQQQRYNQRTASDRPAGPAHNHLLLDRLPGDRRLSLF